MSDLINDPYVIKVFQLSGILLTDAINFTPDELAIQTELPYSLCDKLIFQVSERIANSCKFTAPGFNFLGIKFLLSQSSITEFYGTSSSGKTQLAFSIACQNQFQTVFWLDSEHGFSPDRIISMTGTEETLKKFQVRQITSTDELSDSVNRIKAFIHSHQNTHSTLLVIDSIANICHSRSDKLAIDQIIDLIKSLPCYALIINQVRAIICDGLTKTCPYRPALGKSFDDRVNTKVRVEKHPNKRQLLIERGFQNGISFDFEITDKGCLQVDQ
jgi:Rad51